MLNAFKRAYSAIRRTGELLVQALRGQREPLPKAMPLVQKIGSYILGSIALIVWLAALVVTYGYLSLETLQTRMIPLYST